MENLCRDELEEEFLNHLDYLDEQKSKRSLEEFRQLIIETWIGFCTITIYHKSTRYHLSEYELADLNLLYDTKFEAYYEKSLKEKNKLVLVDASTI